MSKYIVTLEGVSGSGKTTHIDLLKKVFYRATFLRDPGSTFASEDIRDMLSAHKEMNPIATLFLMCAARSDMVKRFLSTDEKGLVFIDGYADHTLAHQAVNLVSEYGGNPENMDYIGYFLTSSVIMSCMNAYPDITFYLDYTGNRSSEESSVAIDRFRSEYKQIVDDDKEEGGNRIHVINTDQPIEKAHNEIVSIIKKSIPEI